MALVAADAGLLEADEAADLVEVVPVVVVAEEAIDGEEEVAVVVVLELDVGAPADQVVEVEVEKGDVVGGRDEQGLEGLVEADAAVVVDLGFGRGHEVDEEEAG